MSELFAAIWLILKSIATGAVNFVVRSRMAWLRSECNTRASDMESASTVRIIEKPIRGILNRFSAQKLADTDQNYTFDGKVLRFTWRDLFWGNLSTGSDARPDWYAY